MSNSSTYKYSRPFNRSLECIQRNYPDLPDEIYNDIENSLGYKTPPKSKSKINALKNNISTLILDLYMAHISDEKLHIGISKNTNTYSKNSRYYKKLSYTYLFKHVYPALLDNNYFTEYPGYFDKTIGKGKVTRIISNSKLIKLFKKHDIKDILIINSSPETVLLRDDNKVLIDYKDTAKTKAMRKNLKIINNQIDSTHINLFIPDSEYKIINRMLKDKSSKDNLSGDEVRYLDFNQKELHRIFNNGNFEQGGRFYHGWWQQIPKEYRTHIHINYKNTVEVDFSGMHFRMIYALEGLTPPDDPYVLKNCSESYRDSLKVIANIMLNAKKRKKGLGAIKKKFKKSTLPSSYKSFDDLVDAFLESHKPIKKWFMSGKGIELQYKDSQLAENIMLKMVAQGGAALPVHDSFIVVSSREQDLKKIMEESFIEMFGVEGKHGTKVTERELVTTLPEFEVITGDLEELLDARKEYGRYNERDSQRSIRAEYIR